MTEKDIVLDAASMMDSALSFYTSAISQTETIELRSLFIKMQDETEKSRNTLYQIAKELNYNIPTQQASQEGINSKESNRSVHEMNSRNRSSCLNTDSAHNYISSQSNGILNHIDTHTDHALQASTQLNTHSIRK